MAARKWEENAQNFTFFAKSFWAQVLILYDNLHERYHFIKRHVPVNKNQVINSYVLNN